MATPLSEKKSLLERLERQIEETKERYSAWEKSHDDLISANEYGRAILGMELSTLDREAAIFSEEILEEEKPTMKANDYQSRKKEITDRKLSAGNSLWQHSKEKARHDDPGAIRLLQPESGGSTILGKFVLGMYRGLDGAGPSSSSEKRPRLWREDVERYYGGTGPYPTSTWCHATGTYYHTKFVRAAHIVPFFLRHSYAAKEILGSRGPELREPSNSLLLLSPIKSWFDQHCLVIVPVDSDEKPKITRWKMELIGKSVANSPYYSSQTEDGHFHLGRELDGKELKFLSDTRPALRFLYFHFIMTLVRIRDIQKPGWKDTWAKYFATPPFPTPGPGLRQRMMLLLTREYQTTDVSLVENWIKGQGFEDPIPLSAEEAARVTSRVQGAVEDEDSEDEDSEDDDTEDEYSEDEES